MGRRGYGSMGIERHDKKTGKLMSSKKIAKAAKYRSVSDQRKAASRSGEVITRKVGEEKVLPPPPKEDQIRKQKHRL